MSEFVIRRGFHGKLSFAVEYGEIRTSKHDAPLARYRLTPEQETLPISVLMDMAADQLTRWAAPERAQKTITQQNSDLAIKAIEKQ